MNCCFGTPEFWLSPQVVQFWLSMLGALYLPAQAESVQGPLSKVVV